MKYLFILISFSSLANTFSREERAQEILAEQNTPALPRMAFDSLSRSDRYRVLIEERAFQKFEKIKTRTLDNASKDLLFQRGHQFASDQILEQQMIEKLAKVFGHESNEPDPFKSDLKKIVLYQPKYDPRSFQPYDQTHRHLDKRISKLAILFADALFVSDQLQQENSEAEVFVQIAVRAWIEAYLTMSRVTGEHTRHIQRSQLYLAGLSACGAGSVWCGHLVQSSELLMGGGLVAVFMGILAVHENSKINSRTDTPQSPLISISMIERKYLEQEISAAKIRFWNEVHGRFRKYQTDDTLNFPKASIRDLNYVEKREEWAKNKLLTMTPSLQESSLKICNKMLSSTKTLTGLK